MLERIRRYSELAQLKTFEERYEYCKLVGTVGSATFGGHRWLNQEFYTSQEWRSARNPVIIRDCGCDLGMPDREIEDRVIVHHLNPVTIEDLENESPLVFDPEFLIVVSENTHKAIHYGDKHLLMPSEFVERRPNDTCPWR